ncbi:MAG TPA: sigma-70 family RNA polymerase sigma factor [Puia sp.]|nr:sigma-70 family RNA polymerase sigma factor [Puia sp.]
MSRKRDLASQFIAFRDGSPSAFAYFFRHYNVRIYYYLLRKVKNVPAAQELTENAFLALFANHSKIESANHLLAFLYYFARHCSARFLQGQPCTEENGDWRVPPASEILGILEDVEVIQNESQTMIQAEIQRLSRQRKKVVEMKFYLQLNVNTIAQNLGISPQTVRNHLSQSMLRLKNRLGEGFNNGLLFI